MEKRKGSKNTAMKVGEVKNILDAIIITKNPDLEMKVEMGCGCDLMSDVLSYIKPGSLLLTGLTSPQVIYTAEVSGIEVVCFVRGKTPQKEIIELAESKDITLLSTHLPMFESCGKLYKKGLKGCSEVNKISYEKL